MFRTFDIQVAQKIIPIRNLNNYAKNVHFTFKFLGFVADIFLHEFAKFHVKSIMCSKVTKVYMKSLKNTTEQHDKVIQATERWRVKSCHTRHASRKN